VSKMTNFRVTVLSVGFGVALMCAPAARAQESCPDHFTENGVELGCPGNSAAQPASHATQAKQTKSAKPVLASAAHVHATSAPVHTADASADKNRTVVAVVPKQ